jgi:hypothetical protein
MGTCCRKCHRRITLRRSIFITPSPSDSSVGGEVKKWVNSQRKFLAFPGQLSVKINTAPGSVEEYEQRRCVVCGAKYLAFGFGPPLTHPGIMLWACGDHRKDLDRQLRPENPPALEIPKATLF